ncbi:MAG TPA: Tex family protein, partial [Gemmataceae bacterium]|nr:Tex family protein [Gemmataceae bacterium]
MHDVITVDFARIAQDLQIRKVQVESVVQLLDEGNTVPFITRYRKERTGGLDEEIIRQIQTRLLKQRQLLERKQTILKSIETQGKLTEDLRQALLAAETSKRLEDLYMPYKPKKRSQATVARERGLEPLAQAVWSRDPSVTNLSEVLPTLVNPEKELKTPEDVLLGVQHILAEQIADTAEIRHAVRCVLWDTGKLTARKRDNLPDGQGLEYKDYFQFSEAARRIPPHRILALNRGEKEGPIQVKMEWDAEAVHRAALGKLPLGDHPHAEFLKKAGEDAIQRLILPSLEREIRRELTEEAETHAVKVFARNLHSLLMQPPLRGKRVLAIDPGFRTGCKIAALDEHGGLLEDAVIFPHAPPSKPPKKKKEEAPPSAAASPPSSSEPSQPTPASASDSGSIPAPVSTEIKPEVLEKVGAESSANPESASHVDPVSLSTMAATIEQPASAASTEATATIAASGDTPSFPALVSAPSAGVGGETTQAPESPSPPLVSALPAASVEQISAERRERASLKRQEARTKLLTIIGKHRVQVIAIGNGTACRETEEFVAELINEIDSQRTKLPDQGSADASGTETKGESVATASTPTNPPPSSSDLEAQGVPADLAYVIVNEAGASVYSASAVGREEFPQYDATLRGTISIGRRLQDPLSELVKIDPQSIGVGLYQHDVNPRHLKESLETVIESSVNLVGVDLNSASVPLLRHVSGLNQLAARDLVGYRKQNGPFKNREQLLQVPNIGPARYVQAAGFLKISDGDNPLDQTWIHPESYPATQKLLADMGFAPENLRDKQKSEELREKLKSLSPEEVCKRLEVGLPTLKDILEALARPGRDPRDDLPPPIFKKGILKLEDLQPGMELKGTVLNVVDFGAFIDIGLKDSGLVHISQMANRYIKSPYEVVSVSDVVTVWVMSVDRDRRRVSLTMIKPGTERKPPERKAEQPRAPRTGPPPRRRPGPPRRPPQIAVPKPSISGASPGTAAASSVAASAAP